MGGTITIPLIVEILIAVVFSERWQEPLFKGDPDGTIRVVGEVNPRQLN